ncbi:hypothetical protein WDU94_003458 [Cyamophila willieti]
MSTILYKAMSTFLYKDYVDILYKDYVDILYKDYVDISYKDYVDILYKDYVDILYKDYVDILYKDYVDILYKDYVDISYKDYVDILYKDYVDISYKDYVDILYKDYRLTTNPEEQRLKIWKEKIPNPIKELEEEIAAGENIPYNIWKPLNRLRVGVARCRSNLKKWNLAEDDTCLCGEVQDIPHLLTCPDLDEPCTPHDLIAATEVGIRTARHWRNHLTIFDILVFRTRKVKRVSSLQSRL